MSGGEEAPAGPDLTAGVPADRIPEGGKLVGRVGEDDVLVARVGGELFAIGAHCTHYHGPLGEGLIVGHEVRCPWHHARFCLRTGEALRAPAIDPVGRWQAVERDGKVFVEPPAQATQARRAAKSSQAPRRVLIVGGGAGGFAAAEMLRRRGFDGDVRIVSADAAAPYDRPNCSKDYLAGEAQPEWMPLRGDDWYADNGVDLRLGAEVGSLDLAGRSATLKSGEALAFDALILAMGCEPVRLPIPGFDRPEVMTLRSLADADAIIAAAGKAKRVAIVGASFIALEAAASLKHRGLQVHVAAPEAIPLARILGDDFGRWVLRRHEANGVVFHLGCKVLGWDGKALALDDGAIEAGFVVAGTGVRPRTMLAEAAGLKVDHGVVVDDRMRASAPNVFAVGDIARYPDPHTGGLIRVEHWVHAERQGQHAAEMILGEDSPYLDTPFFWSAHWGTAVNYVGHAEGFDAAPVEGSLDKEDAAVRLSQGGRVRAVATLGRDLASLEAGARFEAELAS